MTIKAGAPTPSASPSAGPTGMPSGAPTPGEASGAEKFGAAGGTSTVGRVWIPATGSQLKDNLRPGAPKTNEQYGGSWMSTKEAEGLYFQWNQRQRDDFRAKAMVAGLLKFGDGDMEASALWKNLADQAANYGAYGQAVSPLDLLAQYVNSNSKGGQWIKDGDFEVNPLTGERRYVGPQFKTTTATNTNLTDPATARAVATSVFQQLLGRDPGKGEIAAYAQALSQSEAENPSVQTTTTQYDMKTGEAIGSSTVNTGGVSSEGQQLLASDQIKKKPEYANVQAATTYMNALENAVGS